jgi:acetyltransferase-like isoleucine patch superfamily enzyme
LCESDDVGEGTRIWAFAHVMEGAVVGRDCNVCDHAFVETGAVVGDRVTIKTAVQICDKVAIADDVFLGPGVAFTNDLVPRAAHKHDPESFLSTIVRRGASLGANATVRCGVTIGEAAFVGAGAVVLDDVADRSVVVGNPARHIGWMCDCGTRLDDTLACPTCGRSYARGEDGLVLRDP